MSFYIGKGGVLKAATAAKIVSARPPALVQAVPKPKGIKVASFKAVKGPKTVPKIKASKACKFPAKSKFKPSRNARA